MSVKLITTYSFNIQKSRKIVQKLFTEGRLTSDLNKLRGDPLLGSKKKPLGKNQ